MKIVGLITEYNPFHNGHKYHIEQALKLTQADAAIVVMSGNHVQRGTPAILPKHLRATIALSCGAAAVFEIPVYATGSAEYFALGAVSFLERLGCVDCICFGTETSELSTLKEIARILSDEPEAYRTFLQQALKSGDSYPTARQKALTQFTGSDLDASLLELPNNILGIEYLKALYRLHSDIVPYILPRAGAGYHDRIRISTVKTSRSGRSIRDSYRVLWETLSNHCRRLFAAIEIQAFDFRCSQTNRIRRRHPRFSQPDSEMPESIHFLPSVLRTFENKAAYLYENQPRALTYPA